MPRDDIIYPSDGPPVPRWFTYLVHKWSMRQCKKVGHVQTVWCSCDHCGLKMHKPDCAHHPW